MILGILLPTTQQEQEAFMRECYLAKQEAFERECYLATWNHLKAKGFPSDQGKFFKLIDDWGLTEENLLPLGWEVAGRNLVQIKGEKVIA